VKKSSDPEAVEAMRSACAHVRDWVTFHFVHAPSHVDGFQYPVNVLRNVAWAGATTELVLSIDADFVPNENAHDLLVAAYTDASEDAAAKATEANPSLGLVLVVPGFEFSPTCGRVTYNLVPGDTLARARAKFMMSLADLLECNGDPDPTQLAVSHGWNHGVSQWKPVLHGMQWTVLSSVLLSSVVCLLEPRSLYHLTFSLFLGGPRTGGEFVSSAKRRQASATCCC
jgi:hypothetical protein